MAEVPKNGNPRSKLVLKRSSEKTVWPFFEDQDELLFNYSFSFEVSEMPDAIAARPSAKNDSKIYSCMLEVRCRTTLGFKEKV